MKSSCHAGSFAQTFRLLGSSVTWDFLAILLCFPLLCA